MYTRLYTKYMTDSHTVRTVKTVKPALNTDTRLNIVYKIILISCIICYVALPLIPTFDILWRPCNMANFMVQKAQTIIVHARSIYFTYFWRPRRAVDPSTKRRQGFLCRRTPHREHGTGCRQSWSCCGRPILFVVNSRRYFFSIILPARRYTSAGTSTSHGPVFVSVRHKLVFYQNSWTDRADVWHGARHQLDLC